MDFLKLYPNVSVESYKWEWTIPQIKIALHDYTHVVYKNKNKKNKEQSFDNPYDFMRSVGM